MNHNAPEMVRYASNPELESWISCLSARHLYVIERICGLNGCDILSKRVIGEQIPGRKVSARRVRQIELESIEMLGWIMRLADK